MIDNKNDKEAASRLKVETELFEFTYRRASSTLAREIMDVIEDYNDYESKYAYVLLSLMGHTGIVE